MQGKNIGYVRVSSVDQNFGRQLEGVEMDKVFTDKASGKDVNRSALQECFEYLRDGDCLHVHSIDRLARNLVDLQNLITTLVQKGVSVKFHKENLLFDASQGNNPFQLLMFQLLGSFAEFERAMIRERQREGIAIAQKNGVKFGRRGLESEKVSELQSRVANGETIASVCRSMHITPPTVYKYFKQMNSNKNS